MVLILEIKVNEIKCDEEIFVSLNSKHITIVQLSLRWNSTKRYYFKSLPGSLMIEIFQPQTF